MILHDGYRFHESVVCMDPKTFSLCIRGVYFQNLQSHLEHVFLHNGWL